MAVTLDINTLEIRFPNGAGPVKEAIISIPDGDKDTDITVVSPSSGNSIFIVGMYFSENNALNLKFKYSNAGGGKYKVLELAQNQGIWSPIGEGVFALPKDYPLIVQSSAELTNLVIQYVEAKKFYM